MTMALRLGNAALALQLLNNAIDAGHWYHGLREDPDFAALYDSPEFDRIVEICAERRAQAIALAKPIVKTRQPDRFSPPYPLLMALHGNQSNVELFTPHWTSAVEHGWLVALPQSSQAYGPGTFSWNDWEWAIDEVKRHAAVLRAQPAQYPIDPQRVVIAGFSMGAGLAAWLALSDTIDVRGCLLVAPFLSDVDNLLPLLEKRMARRMRVYLVASQDDEYCYGIAQKLAALLPQYGIECEVEWYPEVGHSFPPPFGNRLPDALNFIIDGGPST